MGKEDFTSNDQEQWPGTSMPDWDSSDEASWESFPASDPPAVGSTFRVRPSAGAASEHAVGAEGDAQRRRPLW